MAFFLGLGLYLQIGSLAKETDLITWAQDSVFDWLINLTVSVFHTILFLKLRFLTQQTSEHIFFKIFFFFLIYFWLHWVSVAARGIFVEACGLLSSCGVRVFLFSSCGARVPEHVGSVVCGTWALVEERELSSCGAWAQLPRGMWDLSSLTRDRTPVPCIVRWILYRWTTREVPQSIFPSRNMRWRLETLVIDLGSYRDSFRGSIFQEGHRWAAWSFST